MNAIDLPFRRLLIYSGFLVLIINIPGELLHNALGKAKYGIDLLVFCHFAAAIAYLFWTGQIAQLIKMNWPLVLMSCLAGLAVFSIDRYAGERIIDAAIPLKWYLMWFDTIVLGYLIAIGGRLPAYGTLAILGLLYTLLLADAAIGAYEWRSGDYFFQESNEEETAAGVRQAKLKKVEGMPRIKALDRDVFSFANLMATGIVLCLVLIRFYPSWWIKLGAALVLPIFTFMMIVSSGRSAFFGIVCAVGIFLCSLASPRLTRQYAQVFFALLVALMIAIAAFGIGQTTVFLGQTFMPGSHLADPENAFRRDEVWADIYHDIYKVPQILVAGAPALALFMQREFPAKLDFADHQLIWILYHCGIIGVGLFILYFARIIQNGRNHPEFWPLAALLFFLALVLGEGIARDTLFFTGSLPLFAICGYLSFKPPRRGSIDTKRNRPPRRRSMLAPGLPIENSGQRKPLFAKSTAPG